MNLMKLINVSELLVLKSFENLYFWTSLGGILEVKFDEDP